MTGNNAGKTGTASLSVTAGALDHLVLSPASASITAGGSQAYTAQCVDQYDNSLGDVTATTTFSIAPNGSCTGATCTATAARRAYRHRDERGQDRDRLAAGRLPARSTTS